MTNQYVLAKLQGFVDSTRTDGNECPTGFVTESNQDKEVGSKLSSSWVTNGSEVTYHIPFDEIKGEVHYGGECYSEMHHKEKVLVDDKKRETFEAKGWTSQASAQNQ
jgi:hypothetical protein